MWSSHWWKVSANDHVKLLVRELYLRTRTIMHKCSGLYWRTYNITNLLNTQQNVCQVLNKGIIYLILPWHWQWYVWTCLFSQANSRFAEQFKDIEQALSMATRNQPVDSDSEEQSDTQGNEVPYFDPSDFKAFKQVGLQHHNYRSSFTDRDEINPWWRYQMEKNPHYWPFVRGIHRWPVNSPHKGQWRGALMFSLICAWINAWVNKRDAGDLRRHCAHYDVIVMQR